MCKKSAQLSGFFLFLLIINLIKYHDKNVKNQ